MDILFSASIIASFLAGMVALFAPCCITILLPAYLASAFREKKHILKMTIIFFFGIAVVLVPIGLGAAGLAQLFQNFHKELYILGGAFMLILAILSISGRGLAMIPMADRLTPQMDANNSKSVFALGMFSGAATSCCAPVLAGAMTLAVISGAFWKGVVVTFAYVFGMTIPLFIAAYLYDRFKVENSKFIVGKLIEIRLGTKTFFVHSTNIFAAAVFLLMGVVLLSLAFTSNAFWAPSLQSKIGVALNIWSQNALRALSFVPEFVWGIIVVAIFSFFVYKAIKNSQT